MGENIGNEATDKGLISKIYNQLLWLNIKKQTTQSKPWGEDLKRLSPKIYREPKRLWTSLIIEMQIKTTVKYHLTPVRMANIKKSANNKCLRGCGRKGPLLYYCWEYNLIQPLWRTVWKFLWKLKIELLNDPVIPPLGIRPEHTLIWKDVCTPVSQ